MGGSGWPFGSSLVGGKGAVGVGALLVAGLVVLPFLGSGFSYLPALVVLLVAVFAMEFGLRGGVAAGLVGGVVAFVWLLYGHTVVGGLPAFGVRVALFLLIGGLVGGIVSERRRFGVAVTAHNEMSLELISTASFEGFFTRLNPAWTDVLGWSLDELMAHPFLDFVHPDDVTNSEPEVVRRTVAGLPVFNFQNRYRCRDGSYRWLEWTSRSDQNAKVVHSVARDITVRKGAEETLAMFQGALEQAVRERTADLEERTGELEEARCETLRRLALAAEFRDDETFEHTERVGKMAADLARRIGISAEQTALLRQAAPLHDVGKLALSDSIVLKRVTLTFAEMKEVKKHPENGARILAHSNSDVLQLAEQIALAHHEWWDGSGYPYGLAGDEIPLCARIVAVADVYDALTHVRPYKEAWPVVESIAEICSLRGRQFDPQIVDAFLELDGDRGLRRIRSSPIVNGSLKQTGVARGRRAGGATSESRERETWIYMDSDQTAADMDQAQADSHQSESDADQLTSDSDQAQANLEQHLSNREQAGADSQFSSDPDMRLARALAASRVERDAATAKRDEATLKRDAATVERDAATIVRDAATALRDVATVVRDVATVERDAVIQERDTTAAARSRTTAERLAIADLRDEAARERDLTASARDRTAQKRNDGGAERDLAAESVDRRAAESDREAAAADREHAAADRSYASFDELTGVFRRGAGELALTHEIDRARRSGRSLVLAVIDIDALKALNDSQGHAAGDALLRDVPIAITSALRSYDVTVRWGGDEFVCGLSDVTLKEANDRIDEIQCSLYARRPRASISAGLAEINTTDTLESLIARADTNLYRAKTKRKKVGQASVI